MKKSIVLFILTANIFIITGLLHAQTLEGQMINICDDGAEWPPYTYYKRSIIGEKLDHVIGFSVDIIHEIFDKNGIAFSVQLIPWARCQKNVHFGKDYQMALNVSYNKERAEKYIFSKAYYTTSSYYFYSKKNNPNGLQINHVDDLKKYKVCGVLGYNYETYGFPSGSIDQGAKGFNALIAMIHYQRCTLFIEKYEILAGFKAIGDDYLADKDLGYHNIPGVESTSFYMIISKNYQYGKALKDLIDNGIDELKLSGKLDQILKKYIH